MLDGDMDDFLGWSTERTDTLGPISITLIETPSGKSGVSGSGGGKGFGLGHTSMKTFATPYLVW
jgi:hypothetical protein